MPRAPRELGPFAVTGYARRAGRLTRGDLIAPMRTDRIDVVIVEDDPTLLSAVADAFCEEGFAVRAFTRPEAALELMIVVTPRLVITDQDLPAMLGHELMQRACVSLGHRAPRFVLLADPSTPRVFLAGFDAVLHKPFRLDELLAEARRLGVRRAVSGTRRRTVEDHGRDREETG